MCILYPRCYKRELLTQGYMILESKLLGHLNIIYKWEGEALVVSAYVEARVGEMNVVQVLWAYAPGFFAQYLPYLPKVLFIYLFILSLSAFPEKSSFFHFHFLFEKVQAWG